MGYTSDATMSDQGLRDVERWKDKIEVRLDNRQVFVLFFGSALVACLLFVMGVIVGKRLESRGRAAAPEIEDPLALLDRIASSARPAEPAPPPSTRPAAAQKAPASARATAKGSPSARSEPASKAEGAVAQVAVTAEKAMRAEKAPASPPAGDVESARVAKEPVAKQKPTSAASSPALAASPAADEDVPAHAAAAAEASKSKRRFTLQIGSFEDRAEAVAFAARFGGPAKTYIVTSEVPQKGLRYRVRTGEYGSEAEAKAAKATFERQHGQIAFVAPK